MPERLSAAAFVPLPQVPCMAPDMHAPLAFGAVHILGLGGFGPSAAPG